jgi:hypothetical protein
MLCRLALIFLAFLVPVFADIEIEAKPLGYFNSDWELLGTELIIRDDKPFLRLDTRGNCNYHSTRESEMLPVGAQRSNASMHYECDYRTVLFRLPDEVVLVGNELLYRKGEKELVLGEVEDFLWWQSIDLEENVEIESDISSARLRIHDPRTSMREQQFQKLYDTAKPVQRPKYSPLLPGPAAPGKVWTVNGPLGVITVYYGGGGRTQIRGTYKGVQFDSTGTSQIPFKGRSTGVHEGNSFVKFVSDNITVTLVNNLSADQVPPEHQKVLLNLSPGCIVDGKILTAFVMIRPDGIGIPAAFAEVIELR